MGARDGAYNRWSYQEKRAMSRALRQLADDIDQAAKDELARRLSS
jgi:hypothetical protein